ncbi:1-phosphofructokinase family hexose kinase [Tropicimonas sp. IMCC6043]|uniref:1-phosphofructokinase family hexose kinase n=1 Tax=Tropicimonas sp. IMCC6043 TaxID=2510645 RepID=UPI00101DD6AF|nr:1-phosphofructokinase family hexose kinase [Tropicimonas sp. IMCC6043]RYH11692.1 1-phosphofructokinase family hexose kinase [Tropicimonas sp. IMCC6043]
MHDILTITLNPALDMNTEAEKVIPDVKLRCTEPMVDPGGGGINVARAINHMGGNASAIVAIGGHNGNRLLELLMAEGIATMPIPSPGETRASVVVNCKTTGQQYRFMLPGPPWRDEHVQKAIQTTAAHTPKDGLVIFSGSQPPGVPLDFEESLSEAIRGAGARLIVDTSGAALRQIVEDHKSPPFLLRADDEEAEGLAGQKLETPADTAAFACSLIEQGVAENIIFARGAEGSVLTTPEGSWLATAAKVKVVSKVGAGDSYVGGLTLSLARGSTIQEAARWGAAAASAAVTTVATELCRGEDVERLLPECKLIQL